MILATTAIRAALDSGAIVCDPPPVRIEGAHIDVRLGEWFWVFRDLMHSMNLADADPRDYFTLHRHYCGIGIPPRGFVLAHTAEYVGTAPGSGIVPSLVTRSTLARWGLSVCTANAGWGDEGYCSRWTLEISNPHDVSVALPVGARVGSVAFHRAEGLADAYERRYNTPRAEWTPEAMLPRRGNW